MNLFLFHPSFPPLQPQLFGPISGPSFVFFGFYFNGLRVSSIVLLCFIKGQQQGEVKPCETE